MRGPLAVDDEAAPLEPVAVVPAAVPEVAPEVVPEFGAEAAGLGVIAALGVDIWPDVIVPVATGEALAPVVPEVAPVELVEPVEPALDPTGVALEPVEPEVAPGLALEAPEMRLWYGGGTIQIPDGLVPTGIVEVTLRPETLMTERLFDPRFGTKAIEPSGDMAIDEGFVPTWMSDTRVLVSRSNTVTAFAPVEPLTTKA